MRDIKSSIELLSVLKGDGLLDFVVLRARLCDIGRIDLAQALEYTVIWDVPVGLKGPAQSLKQYPSLKRRDYQMYMCSLRDTKENVDRWRGVLEQACDQLHPPYRMDEEKMREMGFMANMMMWLRRDKVNAILSSVSNCFDPFLRALQVIEDAEVLDPSQIKGLLKTCSDHFEDFKRAANEVQMGIQDGRREDPDGERARKACSIINELGAVILRKHGMEEVVRLEAQLTEAMDNIYTLESVSYTALNWLQMFPCLTILVFLNDLSQCADTLRLLMESHWVYIEQNYEIMSHIVGKEVLEELARKLQKQLVPPTNGSSTGHSHIRTLRTGCYAVLVLLTGKALNCSIDIERSGVCLAEFQLSDDQRDFQIKAGVQETKKVTYAMKEEVKTFRRYVIESCNRLNDMGLKQYAEEVLPEAT